MVDDGNRFVKLDVDVRGYEASVGGVMFGVV